MEPELIDDWGKKKRVPPEPRREGPVAQPDLAKAIRARLQAFEPRILTVHCYEDVGYPWVQVVFDEVIDPGVALRVGRELAAEAGADGVYFNSLRPSAVYFVLEPAFDPEPDLKASRYGAPLAQIEECWSRADEGAGSRGLATGRRSGPARRGAGR